MNAPVSSTILNTHQTLDQVNRAWDEDIVEQLSNYITIPAKSPMFDPDWAQHGFIDTVVRNALEWVQAQKVAGLQIEIVRLDGRTPVLFFEVAASQGATESTAPNPDKTRASDQTVMFYGHLDKQPEFTGWRADLGPWTPKYQDGKLYGRGGADDGYAIYAAITAIQALKASKRRTRASWA